jgi:hypothetical protein
VAARADNGVLQLGLVSVSPQCTGN